MFNKQTTQVGNCVFDILLPNLKEAELKVLLVVFRQTVGWLDKRTGQRKTRDRISSSQFRQKTGMSKRIITKAIQSLIDKHLIVVSNFEGVQLPRAEQRKGKSYLFFSHVSPAHFESQGSAQARPEPAQNLHHNKTKSTKESRTKELRGFCGHAGELVKKYALNKPSSLYSHLYDQQER